MTDAAEQHLRSLATLVPDELISFGRALEQAGFNVDGWSYFLEKPWKWQSEYVSWVKHGHPHEGDPRWSQWVDAMDEVPA